MLDKINTANFRETYPEASSSDTENNPRNKVSAFRDSSQSSFLHKAPKDVIPGIVQGVSMAMIEGIDASSSFFSKLCVDLRNRIASSDNSPLGRLGFGFLSAIFALGSVKSVLELIKSMFAADDNKRSSLLLSGVQALFGFSMALGTFRTLTNAPGMFNIGTITIGALGYLAISLLNNVYTDPNSLIARVLKFFGLLDGVKSLVDIISMKGMGNKELS